MLYVSLHCYIVIILNCLNYQGIRNEFFSHLHKFLAQITDADHRTSGHTKLYVPDEGAIMSNPEAHKNKDFIQRMEGRGLSLYMLSGRLVTGIRLF